MSKDSPDDRDRLLVALDAHLTSRHPDWELLTTEDATYIRLRPGLVLKCYMSYTNSHDKLNCARVDVLTSQGPIDWAMAPFALLNRISDNRPDYQDGLVMWFDKGRWSWYIAKPADFRPLLTRIEQFAEFWSRF